MRSQNQSMMAPGFPCRCAHPVAGSLARRLIAEHWLHQNKISVNESRLTFAHWVSLLYFSANARPCPPLAKLKNEFGFHGLG